MPKASMRPTFDLDTPLGTDEVKARLQGLIDTPGGPCAGQTAGHHISMTVCPDHRHFWSPWLSIEVGEREGGDGAHLHARFSPHPTIWTGVMLSYIALTVLCFFALMFGVSQMIIGSNPWAFWLVPVCLALAAGVWWGAQVGKKLAMEQMLKLKAHVERVLG